MFEILFPNLDLVKAWMKTKETLYMTGVSLIFVFIFGLIIGLLLFLTSEENTRHIRHFRWFVKGVHWALASFVNIFRSIPFVLLIVLLLPVTKSIVGSMIGKEAAIPALVIGTAPFYARMVEIGLREIDKGVIEAAKAMGAVRYPDIQSPDTGGFTSDCIRSYGYRHCTCGKYRDCRDHRRRWFRRFCLFRWIFTKQK